MSSTRMWVVLCLLAAGGTPALAQVGAGQITGVVKDAIGRAPDPRRHGDGDQRGYGRASRRRRDDGRWLSTRSPDCAPGDVPGRRGSPEFPASTIREGIRVETGETVRLDVRIVIGGHQREQLIVSGDVPLLRAATASLGEVVSQEKIVRCR